MAKVIYKYPVSPRFELSIPADAEILSIQTQMGAPVMWVKLDPGARCASRHFFSVATGEEFSDTYAKYLGTFQLPGGGLVFHVFEATL